MNNRFRKYYVLLPLLLLAFFYTLKAMDFPIHDFSNYYCGGRLIASGIFDANIYFPYWFNAAFSPAQTGLFMSYAPNTPFLALVFAPFTIVGPAGAKFIFNILGLLLLVFSSWRLYSHLGLKPVYLLLLPLLFLVPIKNNLLFGQVYFLLFFLLAESWMAYKKQQFAKTGLLLALAIMLKIFPALLLLQFVFRKEIKPLFYTLGFCLLCFGITLAFVDLHTWIFYFHAVLPKASNGEISQGFVSAYQSVFMFGKELLVFDAVENPKVFFDSPLLFAILLIAFKTAVVAMGYFISKKHNTLAAFAYWLLAAIVLTPYGSTYGFLVLLPAYFYLASAELTIVKKAILIGLLGIVNNLPLSYFTGNVFPFSYPRLFALLGLLGGIVWLLRKAIQWKWVVSVSCASLLLGMLLHEEKPVNSASLLPKNSPVLLYDFFISKNRLTYYYWDANGRNRAWVKFRSGWVKSLIIRDNQVYDGQKQLTYDKSNKQKALLVDNKTVVYLSDYGRGIGFYTLRKIDLHAE